MALLRSRFVWIALSVGLYAIALNMHALTILTGQSDVGPAMSGADCLHNGSLLQGPESGDGPMTGTRLLYISWVGNLVWFLALVSVGFVRTQGIAIRIGGVATLMSLLVLIPLLERLPIYTYYQVNYVVRVGPGYVLWVAALATPAVAGWWLRRSLAAPHVSTPASRAN